MFVIFTLSKYYKGINIKMPIKINKYFFMIYILIN